MGASAGRERPLKKKNETGEVVLAYRPINPVSGDKEIIGTGMQDWLSICFLTWYITGKCNYFIGNHIRK